MQKEIVFDSGIETEQPLFSPESLRKKLPVSEENAAFVNKSRMEIRNILEKKDKRFLLIAGPCSIHEDKASLEYAGRLCTLAKKYRDLFYIIMRVYFEKPRTALGWRGFITEPEINGITDIPQGLEKARSLLIKIAEMQLPAACEFLNPAVPGYIADLISWASIGARSAESQIHRELASGLSMPAGFKNATNGEIMPAVNGIAVSTKKHAFLGISRSGISAVIYTKGNPAPHLVLRGGTVKANCDANSILNAENLLKERGIQCGILIDCSHGNSFKNPARQAENLINSLELRFKKAPGFNVIRGCMIESFILEGSVAPEKCKNCGEYGRSITDPCMSFSDFEKLLEKAYAEYSPFLKNNR